MTSAPTKEASTRPTDANFDPDAYRMTLGEHLEELRWRLVLGLLGFVAAAIVCFIYGEEVMSIFCQPLVNSLRKYDLNPQIYLSKITDAFVVYMQISLISAFVLTAPWLLYQLWQFVRAGLYPSERHLVTRYMPLSIGLLISGMLFLYFVVLPITLNFLIAFSINVPLKGEKSPIVPNTTQPVTITQFDGDPKDPVANQIWIDKIQKRVKINFEGQIRVVPFGPQNLMAPMITLPEYMELVLKLLLMFGLTFQLPLVMLAVVKMGFVEVASLRKWRRAAYFGIAILCGVVVPDVVTGMIAMMIPLMILYEVGIFMAARSKKVEPEEEEKTEAS
jgi:sec-independent protein translocase protein TatC